MVSKISIISAQQNATHRARCVRPLSPTLVIALVVGCMFLITDFDRAEAQLSQWKNIVPAGVTPSARESHGLIKLDEHGVLLLFGGLRRDADGTSSVNNELWMFDMHGGTWTHTTPVTQFRPLPRAGHTMVLRGNAVIVFGGFTMLPDGVRVQQNDAWQLTYRNATTDVWGMFQWIPMFPSGSSRPVPRSFHAATVDPTGAVMYVFGGQQANGRALGDMWILTESRVWFQVTRNVGHDWPPARFGHSFTLLPLAQVMLVFGGVDADNRGLNDVWAFDLTKLEWQEMLPTTRSPSPRGFHAATLHDDFQILVVGGEGATGVGMGSELSDGHVFDLFTMAWRRITTKGFVPMSHFGMIAADGDTGVTTFGGRHGLVGIGYGLRMTTSGWVKLLGGGLVPEARVGHALVDFGPWVYVWGGQGQRGGENGGHALSDLWRFDTHASKWHHVPQVPTAAPPGRGFMAWAVHRDGSSNIGGQQLVFFGGVSTLDRQHGDLWILDIASTTWTQCTSIGSVADNTRPDSRAMATAVILEGTRLFLFGGLTRVGFVSHELWSIDLRPISEAAPGLDMMLAFDGYDDYVVADLSFDSVPPAPLTTVPVSATTVVVTTTVANITNNTGNVTNATNATTAATTLPTTLPTTLATAATTGAPTTTEAPTTTTAETTAATTTAATTQTTAAETTTVSETTTAGARRRLLMHMNGTNMNHSMPNRTHNDTNVTTAPGSTAPPMTTTPAPPVVATRVLVAGGWGCERCRLPGHGGHMTVEMLFQLDMHAVTVASGKEQVILDLVTRASSNIPLLRISATATHLYVKEMFQAALSLPVGRAVVAAPVADGDWHHVAVTTRDIRRFDATPRGPGLDQIATLHAQPACSGASTGTYTMGVPMCPIQALSFAKDPAIEVRYWPCGIPTTNYLQNYNSLGVCPMGETCCTFPPGVAVGVLSWISANGQTHTWRKVGRQLDVYLDGSWVAHGMTHADWSVAQVAKKLYIGGYPGMFRTPDGDEAPTAFRGRVDNVRLWDSLRTPGDILKFSKASLDIASLTNPNLVATFSFHNSSFTGTRVVEESQSFVVSGVITPQTHLLLGGATETRSPAIIDSTFTGVLNTTLPIFSKKRALGTWTLYSPTTDTTPWPPVRFQHTMVVSSTRRLLIHGGFGSVAAAAAAMSDAWEFDLQSGQWRQSVAELPAVGGHIATSEASVLVTVLGGTPMQTSTQADRFGVAQYYNRVDKVVFAHSKRPALKHAAVAGNATQLYVFGGRIGDALTAGTVVYTPSDTMLQADIVAPFIKGDMPTPRIAAAVGPDVRGLALYGGAVVVPGTNTYEIRNDLWFLDAGSQHWETVVLPPTWTIPPSAWMAVQTLALPGEAPIIFAFGGATNAAPGAPLTLLDALYYTLPSRGLISGVIPSPLLPNYPLARYNLATAYDGSDAGLMWLHGGLAEVLTVTSGADGRTRYSGASHDDLFLFDALDCGRTLLPSVTGVQPQQQIGLCATEDMYRVLQVDDGVGGPMDSRPGARFGHFMAAYADFSGNKLVVFGGGFVNTTAAMIQPTNNVWIGAIDTTTLSGARVAWSLLRPSGDPNMRPAGRLYHSATLIIDSPDQPLMIVFGGNCYDDHGDVWYDSTLWGLRLYGDRGWFEVPIQDKSAGAQPRSLGSLVYAAPSIILSGGGIERDGMVREALVDSWSMDLSAPFPSKCVARGTALRRAVAGEASTFFIDAVDVLGRPAYNVEFEVSIRGSVSLVPAVYPQATLPDVYEVAYTAIQSGTYTVSIMWEGNVIGVDGTLSYGITQLEVEPGPTYPPHCVVTGAAISTATAGVSAQYEIEARDRFFNRVAGGDDVRGLLTWYDNPRMFRVAAVRDHADGTYGAQYVLTVSGRYVHSVTFSGQHASGSPFEVNVMPAVAHTSRTYAYGSGLTVAVAGEPSVVLTQTRDRYDNNLTMGGENIAFELLDPEENFAPLASVGKTLSYQSNGLYRIVYYPFEASRSVAVSVTHNGVAVAMLDEVAAAAESTVTITARTSSTEDADKIQAPASAVTRDAPLPSQARHDQTSHAPETDTETDTETDAIQRDRSEGVGEVAPQVAARDALRASAMAHRVEARQLASDRVREVWQTASRVSLQERSRNHRDRGYGDSDSDVDSDSGSRHEGAYRRLLQSSTTPQAFQVQPVFRAPGKDTARALLVTGPILCFFIGAMAEVLPRMLSWVRKRRQRPASTDDDFVADSDIESEIDEAEAESRGRTVQPEDPFIESVHGLFAQGRLTASELLQIETMVQSKDHRVMGVYDFNDRHQARMAFILKHAIVSAQKPNADDDDQATSRPGVAGRPLNAMAIDPTHVAGGAYAKPSTYAL